MLRPASTSILKPIHFVRNSKMSAQHYCTQYTHYFIFSSLQLLQNSSYLCTWKSSSNRDCTNTKWCIREIKNKSQTSVFSSSYIFYIKKKIIPSNEKKRRDLIFGIKTCFKYRHAAAAVDAVPIEFHCITFCCFLLFAAQSNASDQKMCHYSNGILSLVENNYFFLYCNCAINCKIAH